MGWTFPKHRRLLKSSEYKEVQERGQRFYSKCLLYIWFAPEPESSLCKQSLRKPQPNQIHNLSMAPQEHTEEQKLVQKGKLGLVVSKRVGPAVFRNQLKRWIREAFRLHAQELKKIQLVVVARATSVRGVWKDVDVSMRSWVRMVPDAYKGCGKIDSCQREEKV